MTDINLSAVAKVLGWKNLECMSPYYEGEAINWRYKSNRGVTFCLSNWGLCGALLEAMSKIGNVTIDKHGNYPHQCCCSRRGVSNVYGTGSTWLEAVMRCAEKL